MLWLEFLSLFLSCFSLWSNADGWPVLGYTPVIHPLGGLWLWG
jgi:hypothetical protein